MKRQIIIGSAACGLLVLAGAYTLTTRYTGTQKTDNGMYVLDRWTGNVRFCSASGCRTLEATRLLTDQDVGLR